MSKQNDPSQEIQDLEKTIADLEAQRSTLGNITVDTAIRSLREKQAQLTASISQQQRKLATILFLDIAGHTQLTRDLDPEDKLAIIDAALVRLSEPIIQHGGHITGYMGDGFMAVFGVPTARESDPEHAIRASLEIQARAREIATEFENVHHLPGFRVRVGIDTGLVVAGQIAGDEDSIKGNTVVMSARLESAAPPGEILISHNTYRHVRGVFDVESQEPLPVKGFAEPMKAYRVLRARPRAFRVMTRGVEGIETRMVGRVTELKYLQDALLNAIEQAEGQMVTISGEAGVGKSRLLYEFQNWLDLLPPPAVRFFEGRAHQEALHLPCGMLRDLFASRFQMQDDDLGETVREKLTNGFGEVFNSQPDGEMRIHLLGQWLGFDFSSSLHLKGVLEDPEQLRNRALMYLGEYFKGISDQRPVVIFLEDIHWADDSTLDALNWLGERIQKQRILIVFATRPTLYERRPYWGEGLTYHHSLRLEPLSKRESRQLVSEILALVEQVPPELRELVVEGAEGNPFYVEELIKMLVEAGIIVKGEDAWQICLERLEDIEVPPTLAGVLQARLDSLSADERAILQQASVVGRLFWDRVVAYIQAAEGGQENIIPETLAALRSREFIYRREQSAFTDAREYLFKHDILREVTYESVLKRLRKVYHGLVANWLIAQGDERAGEFSGLIAGHLLQAGRRDEAGQYFLRAGESAVLSYANAEAEAHFHKALELLPPASPQRAPCLAGLGNVLGRQGRGEEATPILRQAIELYWGMGEHDRVALLYTRLSAFLWYSDNKKAWDTCQEGLRQLEGVPEGPGLARLLAEAGRTAFYSARSSKEEVISLCQRAIELADHIGDLVAKAAASITLAVSLSRSDYNKALQILQDVIVMAEANGLWDATWRAYFNFGAISSRNFENLETSYKKYLRAMEISAQTGWTQGALFALGNLVDCAMGLGQLRTIEATAQNILRSCSASPARVAESVNELQAGLSYFRGEWVLALESFRQAAVTLQQSSKFQLIAGNNSSIVVTILELNRFMGLADLSEAEAALRENIGLGDWNPLPTYCLRVILASRQKLCAQARQLLVELFDTPEESQLRPVKIYRLAAEMEILLAEEHWDEAVAACRELIAIYQAGGYRWQHARKLIDLGDALAGRCEPGDLEEARATYQQALEMFTEMGAPGYVQVLDERLKR